jgi:choline-sulfatase
MSDQPNVLLIMSDQHHKRALGCAGHPLVQTPNLDALAARGQLFSSAYCNFPLCGPSRASFMTGRHPCETEVWSNAAEFRSDMPTYAHAFGGAGYETVLSGRMHFVGSDQRHGFQRRLISDCPASAYIAAGWRLQDVLGYLVDTPGMSRTGLEKSGPGRSGYLAFDEAVTAATVAFLDGRADDTAERPLLLTVGYAMPHCPFVADPEDFDRYYADVPEPTLTDADLADQHPFLQQQRERHGSNPLPPPEVARRVTAAYLGMVSHLDRQVGQVLDALERAGMADNTIIVYTSDHGEQYGEHGCWWKQTFYEGSVGVPLIVAQPGDAGDVQRRQHVSLMDIGPTLLDLAGVRPLPGASGRSFRCLLEGNQDDWDNTVLAEYTDGTPGCPQRMIRRDQWKFVYHRGMRPQLYNLDTDPAENDDLGECPAHAEVRAALEQAVLADWDADAVAARNSAVDADIHFVGRWQRASRPPEPDPVWFDTPPENYVLAPDPADR